ncbi:ACD11 homolog protein-like [Nicotiana tabacum]|uniref:ACD11 homolog protein-like n=1 Tax=Nicotiana tabacum TaxID=4097 RepID=A0A1S4B704_TOBAC|nr:PREDICTED: ACD11 homolog protein-like isoform X2 [Nicotiana tabacum]
MALQFYSLFKRRDKRQHCREKETKKAGSTRITRIPMDEDDGFEDAGTGTPLSAIAEAFEELSSCLKSNGYDDLRLKPFCDACSLVSVLFGCLGIAFKFAELEYVSKVRDLAEASEVFGSLNSILDSDVRSDTVRTPGSLSRNLRRVRQGLDLIRALFQNFLSTYDDSLKEAASMAYAKVCAPYHTWAVRTAVSAGMCALPTRDQLLMKLNETDDSAEREMRRYIDASLPIIEYIDKLYISRSISLDW